MGTRAGAGWFSLHDACAGEQEPKETLLGQQPPHVQVPIHRVSGKWEMLDAVSGRTQQGKDFPHCPETSIFKLLHMFPFITSHTHLL